MEDCHNQDNFQVSDSHPIQAIALANGKTGITNRKSEGGWRGSRNHRDNFQVSDLLHIQAIALGLLSIFHCQLQASKADSSRCISNSTQPVPVSRVKLTLIATHSAH